MCSLPESNGISNLTKPELNKLKQNESIKRFILDGLSSRFKTVFEGFQNLKIEHEQTNNLEWSMRNYQTTLASLYNNVEHQNPSEFDKYVDEYKKLLDESEKLIVRDKSQFEWNMMMESMEQSIESIKQNLDALQQPSQYTKIKPSKKDL